DVLTEFRDLGQSMSNRFMLENDLIFVIKKELERVNRSKMYKISFILDGDYEFLDKDVELIVFRVFQESLHNIIKHAKADSIRVHIKYDPEEMIIEIKDNGVGFDNEKKSEGSGLKNMNDRLEMIHAHLLIQTSFSTGTTLIIKIPTNGRK